MKAIKVVSLFSGCGGLDYGFKELGYNIIWANDILKDACETYKINIGEHIVCGNIDDIDLKSIPKADLLIGGPPCQSFSLVGKRDPKDSRSNLVWSYLDILKQVDPKIFLLENVTGIKSAKNDDGTKVIDNLISAFNALGYTTSVFKLNAADYGVPQKRHRIFIVGNKLNVNIEQPPATHEGKWITSEEALGDMNDTTVEGTGDYLSSPQSDYQKIMRKLKRSKYSLHLTPYASKKDAELITYIPPGGNYQNVPDNVATKRILNFKATGGRTTTYGRLKADETAYTLNTHFNRLNVGCNIHYKFPRLISLREGLRIQSFPDDFEVVSSNKRNFYVQIGNAVPPLLGKAWAKHLLNFF